MAAVEVLECPEFEVSSAPYLRLVVSPPPPSPFAVARRSPNVGPLEFVQLNVDTAPRAVVALVTALAVLAVPGHVFGATTGAGLPGDVATSSVLASGMDYVVQPGDTLQSIARLVNPIDPNEARTLLVRELGSDIVVPGEHVLIP